MEKVVTTAGPFSGNDFTTPSHKLGLGRPEASRNVIADRDGSLRLRPAALLDTEHAAFVCSANMNVTAIGRVTDPTGVTRCVMEAVDRSNNRYILNSDGFESAAVINAIGHATTYGKYAYFAQSNGIYQIDATLLTVGVATPTLVAGTGALSYAEQILVAPWDERMFHVGLLGRVSFSEPGDVNTWPATNYEQLGGPGGVTIDGAAVWRQFVFVWSGRDCWVFYGTGTNAVGGPELQYRKVATDGAQIRSGCAGPDGLYLLTDAGLSRSQGGDFRPVGDDRLRGLWNGVVSAPNARSLTNTVNRVVGELVFNGPQRIAAFDEHIALCYAGHTIGTGGSPRSAAFVLDTRTGQWSFWTGQFSRMGTAYGFNQEVVLLGIGTDMHLYPFRDYNASNDTLTGPEDLAHAVWQSGVIEAGGPAQEWTARELQVLGSGPLNVALVTDDVTVQTAAAVTLGVASGYGFLTTQAAGYHRVAARGQRIAVRLAGFTRETTVRRLALMGDYVRDPTMRASAAG